MTDADARTGDDPFYYMRSRGESISAMLTDSDRDMLLQSLDVHPAATAASRAIPVPGKSAPLPNSISQPPSQASSHGSSGSGFMTSVLNNSNPLSHTPPVATSYEAAHFGKRSRSGSISGRLQSASDYLQDRGLLDQSTRAVLKDLIILGDSELQQALDLYEQGNASLLEQMIQSGGLQHRLPADLDLLGDLDLDFMTMKGEEADFVTGGAIEPLRGGTNDPEDEPESQQQQHQRRSRGQASSKTLTVPAAQKVAPSATFPGYHGDGIGDLEFAGDFMGPDSEYMLQMPAQALSSANGSPSADSYLSEQERRIRSNSLFSALLDPPTKGGKGKQAGGVQHMSVKQVFDHVDPTMMDASVGQQGIHIAPRRASALERRSMLAESLDLAKVAKPKTTYKKREKKQAAEQEEEEEERLPGSGRPRTWSDPNLNQYIDSNGLLHVDRPEGWIGAYSPESRKVRIERFLEKRNHRVWSKHIKYDVRKNFADSRLRVKGRFVKKEDELLMRELISLT